MTESVIGAAIEVHRELGPGLLESVYESALAVCLAERGHRFRRQHPIPVLFRGEEIGEFRLDLVIEDILVIEVKAVARHEAVFDAQLLSYMRLGNFPVGLLINFNTRKLVDGLRRRILDPLPADAPCLRASVANPST